MNTNELINNWKAEEEIAHIHGWNFAHIDGRYTEQDDLPWDYRATIEEYLRPEMKIMDIDTGGGEFLLSLNHPRENTAATENYPPNVELCKDVLLPLGIHFLPGDGKEKLPFDDSSFDMVINRHGDFNAEEIYRVLKPGGYFILTDYFSDDDTQEQFFFRELAQLKAEQGVTDNDFYHYDTPLTVAHETEALTAAGFSRVEDLAAWGATHTLKAYK